ncbi:MAG: YhfC family intramembrane metalloprotease [Oscillospiraceae bacterium]|nr:YhfC family intramembrane metalloprotease [Oscillospiraceae bacterium]
MDVFSCIFVIICSIVLPIVVTVIFCVRKKETWKPILFGALTFTVFQVFLRFSLLRFILPNQEWFILMSSAQSVLYALFLGGTAALFEEGGRFVVMSIFLKKQRSTLDGIAFGVGHGGIEAMFVVGLNAIYMLLMSTFPSAAEAMFAGGVERLSTMVIQIAFSVLVMKTVREKNYLWLILAFVIHTIIDFGAVMATEALNLWTIEAVILFLALIAAGFVRLEYKKENKKE